MKIFFLYYEQNFIVLYPSNLVLMDIIVLVSNMKFFLFQNEMIWNYCIKYLSANKITFGSCAVYGVMFLELNFPPRSKKKKEEY